MPSNYLEIIEGTGGSGAGGGDAAAAAGGEGESRRESNMSEASQATTVDLQQEQYQADAPPPRPPSSNINSNSNNTQAQQQADADGDGEAAPPPPPPRKSISGLQAVGRGGPTPFTLEEAPYYFAAATRDTANQLLADQATGVFMVRPGQSNKNSLTLSVRGQAGVLHLQIHCVNGQFTLGGPDSKMFNSVVELIFDHQNSNFRVRGGKKS